MSIFEDRHHALLRRWVSSPTLFDMYTTDSPEALGGSLKFSNTDKLLSTVVPDDMRDFYFKDCMIYLNTFMSLEARLELLDTIYIEWFPHRDRAQDFARGNFVAGFLRSKHGTEPLDALARFYCAALCLKLKEVEPDVREKEPSIVHPDYKKPRQKGLFKMRPSFQNIFLVLDKIRWEEEGVLVVSKDERVSAELGKESEELSIDGLGSFKVFRAKLESVMRSLVAEDLERSEENREWSDWYDKWCGGDDKDPPRRYGG